MLTKKMAVMANWRYDNCIVETVRVAVQSDGPWPGGNMSDNY